MNMQVLQRKISDVGWRLVAPSSQQTN